MPPKRKATEPAHTSPSKRAALSSRTTTGSNDPVNQPTSPATTPKLLRTYGKRTEKGQEALQNTINTIPECTNERTDTVTQAELEIPSPMKNRARKKEVKAQGSPTKRPSKSSRSTRTKTTDSIASELTPDPIESPHRPQRTHTRKVVVEVPPLPTLRRAQSPPPLPQKSTQISVTLRKNKTTSNNPSSPSKTQSLLNCKQLPLQFHTCLKAQKKAILRSLYAPSKVPCEEEQGSTRKTAKGLLGDLLNGTVTRSEGNSCLLLGARGSGKSTVLDQCLRSLPVTPIIIRLSGWIHHTDRLAMREIAYQLGQQTGKSFLQEDEDEDDPFIDQDENPFLDRRNPDVIEPGLALPPPSHLPTLISVIPTLSRPTVIILDAFDLFALHPRQALLYCLLDTVQGSRTMADNKGFAVIGLTTRIDTINLLEKRVKSRFSGRVIRTSSISATKDVVSLFKSAFCTPITNEADNIGPLDEWNKVWSKRIQEFLDDKESLDMMGSIVGIVKDPRLLFHVLVRVVAQLSPDTPFPTPSVLSLAIASQCSRPPSYDFLDLPYPAICLLIASLHSATSGHEVFTFEMLSQTFRKQIRASVAAPVQVNGGSIGMVSCSKHILLAAFEHLISMRIFVAAAATSSNMAKEFARYRMTIDREEVRRVTERTGQVMLKKWLNKAE